MLDAAVTVDDVQSES